MMTISVIHSQMRGLLGLRLFALNIRAFSSLL
jgi:hypothetical protein